MENTQKPDDIELGLVFAKIGDFFKSIGYGIIRFIALLRNVPVDNKILFALLTVAGGVIGLSYSTFLKRKFFESSMVLSCDYVSKRIIDNAIEKLNLLAGEETSKGLSRALHISDSLAANIMKFEAKPFVAEKEIVETEILKEQLKNAQINSKNQAVIDQVIKRISIENQHAFEFTVRTYSPTSIKPLQDALVNHFKNNDFIKKRILITHDNLLAKRDKLRRDSNKLDSLKKVIYSNYKTMAERPQGSNNVILSDKSVTNPVEIYNQDLSLYDELQWIESRLFLQPDFEVVDGFTEFDEPASASRPKIIATGMLIGFLFGYLVVALRRFDKYLSVIK